MQLLNSVYSTTPNPKGLPEKDLYERIQSPPDNGEAIMAIRDADAKERSQLKKALPIYVPSANLGGSRKDVLSHTNYLFFDFDMDSAEDARQLKSKLKSVCFARLIYTSPSGDGIHLLVKASGATVANHKDILKACKASILRVIGKEYEPDAAATDVNRAVFLSYDPEAIYIPNSDVYEYAPIGASLPLKVESKILPFPVSIIGSGEVKGYERFHRLAVRPNGFITRPYGELFPLNDCEDYSNYEYGDNVVGKIFEDTPLSFVELKDKFVGYRTRGKYLEGERDYQLTRLGNYFFWLNPEATEKDIMNYATYLANWTEGEDYDKNRIAAKLLGLRKRFDPRRVNSLTERSIIWNSDNDMKPNIKAILQKGEGYYKALIEAGEANIEIAITKLIEQRDNQYEALSYIEITDFINETIEVYFKSKTSISRRLVTRRIQESDKLLKMYSDYNKGRYSRIRAEKIKYLEEVSVKLGGYTNAQLAEATGIPERTIKDLYKALREHYDNRIIE